MKKSMVLLMCGLLGVVGLIGCGKQNPVASQESKADNALRAKTFRPGGVIYSAYLSGNIGQKPWYWFDATDNPDYNATITVSDQHITANINRVNGDNWGKVRTFPIAYANTANAVVNLRIGVPFRAFACAWKILIQEDGGAWRTWTLQDSTTETGYKDYNLTEILAQVNQGSGRFTIDLVVEGGIGQHIEISDLYVFTAGEELPAGAPYWYESRYNMYNQHTHGWFDETTNPGFHAVIQNTAGHAIIQGNVQLGGKVQSPMIPWDPQHCRTLYLRIMDPKACFSVWVQEQTGEYRQWQVSKTFVEGQGWVCDFTSVTEMAPGTLFSITIADVFGTLWLRNIYLY